jgi:hypothetical protein
MQPTRQTYASITNADFRAGGDVPVASEQEAVQKTLAARGIYFRTYEVAAVVLDGQELKGKPENYSGRRFVDIERTYTREEVFTAIEKIFGRMGPNDSVRQAFMEYPEGSAYITGLERPGEFIRIEEGEKVFNRAGGQIWPLAAPDVTAANAVTPMKKIRLKGPN